MKNLALVTGGIRGIGAAISRKLFQEGYKVIATYHHDDAKAQEFSKSSNIPVYRADTANPEQCQDLCETLTKEHGSIDVLVLNAGITRDALLHKMTLEMWEDVIRTDLSSCFYMTRAVLPSMYEREYGRIILLSSINGVKGQRGQTNYCAAKAGVIGFMKALAQEAISKSVTVNAVAPGYTDTDMVKAVPAPILEKIIAQIPVGRLGRPEEIARCVAFLASEDAGFITGHTLHVNGGQYTS